MAKNQFKVCVYAICKNEAQFVQRWLASMSEADAIYVLDTGSSDDTVRLLQEGGAQVAVSQIKPWRFDVARNQSLDMVPQDADICVCTDLDEVLQPGWRPKLEAVWAQGAGRAKYRYTWSFNDDGSEGSVFWVDKVHCRHGYRWVNPVHEVLYWEGDGDEPLALFAEGVQLNHYPDRSKSRGQYLPLLELAVQENPQNDRNMHYLGREYMYYGRWQDCIDTLKRHLQLPSALWRDERAASMRFIARSYQALGQDDEAESWYLRAVAEAPHLREPWLEFARLAYQKADWNAVIWLTERALKITERPRTYITEADSWGFMPYDLAALGYYNTGQYLPALQNADVAAAICPQDERLQRNRQVIWEKLAEQGNAALIKR